jgi:hypothetical protein
MPEQIVPLELFHLLETDELIFPLSHLYEG